MMEPNIYSALLYAIKQIDTNNVLKDSKRDILASDLGVFCVRAIDKYIEGQKEHGGNLEDRDLLKDIEQESIDLVHYINAMKRKLQFDP